MTNDQVTHILPFRSPHTPSKHVLSNK